MQDKSTPGLKESANKDTILHIAPFQFEREIFYFFSF